MYYFEVMVNVIQLTIYTGKCMLWLRRHGGGRNNQISFASGHSWSICQMLLVPKCNFVGHCADFNPVLYRHLMLDLIMVECLRWHFLMF